MDKIFHHVSFDTSRLITKTYSTSFSIGVRCLHPSIRNAIYSIYGFVRLADEIVDSFHDYDKEQLLEQLEDEYYQALQRGISLNPIINAFCRTVHTYQIEDHLIQAFLKSMKEDLKPQSFGEKEIDTYIYGSAEVVGLMCLAVFVSGDKKAYTKLEMPARRLGAAFQKVNFLRDLNHDTLHLQRAYFPVLQTETLNETNKKEILNGIYEDYEVALDGIRQLPDCARLGVYTAYLYYLSLAKRIEETPAGELMQKRIRITNKEKMYLFRKAYLTTKII
ncbi:MAG: phytoene/squalene synthase family protein [Tannerellaceae bacterium]|nr:phytoene/squalene synthase family protein [Tannerellaceae bacterium]